MASGLVSSQRGHEYPRLRNEDLGHSMARQIRSRRPDSPQLLVHGHGDKVLTYIQQTSELISKHLLPRGIKSYYNDPLLLPIGTAPPTVRHKATDTSKVLPCRALVVIVRWPGGERACQERT